MITRKTLGIIGAEFGWGAKRHETQNGPALIRARLEQAPEHDMAWLTQLASPNPYTSGKALTYEQRLQEVQQFTQRLSDLVKNQSHSHFPIVMGGDHSIAIGTWSGMMQRSQAKNDFGLIWIDAHMDSHTPETTPSFAIHGMPLAVLMGHGDASLQQNLQGHKLNPKNVILIGVRSYESGEAKLLESLNVRVYFIDEVKQRGFDVVLEEACRHMNENTSAFGISFDIDALDPTVAPGTGAAEPNGLLLEEVLPALTKLNQTPKLAAFEIVEFDPTRDIEHKTEHVVLQILKAILGKSTS